MKEETMTLGLDIGPNSIGWTLAGCRVLADGLPEEPFRLIDAGARVFQEGVDRTPQGSEKSRNVQRREARAARRLHQRRNRRRKDLKAVLQDAGLLPKDEAVFAALMSENPYRLRASGLDEKLSLFEFGRAIYHLSQRRGFKSNRKAERKEDNTKIGPAISELREHIKSSGNRTLGEYLHKELHGNLSNPIRGQGHYTHRDMYETEFNLLWESQLRFYPAPLTNELRGKIYDTIFYQRPLRIQKFLVGRCEYEPDKRRSPRGAWFAQRFRLLQDVNNMNVTDTSTGEVRPLSEVELEKLISTLGQSEEMTFDKIRKKLGLTETSRFNLEEAGRKKLKGNAAEWNLIQVFKKDKKDYDELQEHTRDEIVRELLFVEDEKILRRHAASRWGLGEKAVERLLSTRLESGYIHLSEKAIKKLLPHMEAGKTYMDAVTAAGYERRDQRTVHSANMLSHRDIPELRNPLVSAALYQLRRVVNAVVREYGRPAKIRVEMVRDLKNTGERRKEMIKKQRENEKRNEDAWKRLTEDFGAAGSSRDNMDDIVKYKLWEECGHECPYTGNAIPKEALLSPEVEIEHISPYSRSLDDSYMNKTLCFANENRNIKHNKTPWEAYGHNEDKWGGVLKRIQRLPMPKKARFYMKEIPDDFISRQLNDTAYIAREARAFLEKTAGKNNVQVGKGQITATLRRLWGLNTVLGADGEKNRADHRHHAVDAVVVALTSPKVLKLMSEAGRKSAGARIRDFKQPWEGFRDEVRQMIDKIIVSYRVQRKASGPLHEETNYGILDKKDKKKQPMYAVRKPLSALTKKEITLIADEKVREIVMRHFIGHGVDPETGDEKSAEWKKAVDPANPPYLPNKNGPPVPIKKVRLHKPSNAMIHLGSRAVEAGSNHHIVIYEHTDGENKGRWDGEVVSMFDAARRIKEKKPVIERSLGEGKKFIMSLSRNEMIRIGIGADAKYYRVQKMDMNKNIAFRPHNLGGKLSDSDKPPLILRKNSKTLGEIGAVKVTVDPIGRVRRAND